MSQKSKYKIARILSHITLIIFISCNTPVPSIISNGKHYIPIDSTLSKSAETESIIEPYRKHIEKKMNKVIGYSKQNLTKGRPESYLSNFIADILLAEGIEIAKNKNLPIPKLSIINVKGLRSPIKRGSITVGNIYRLMPFENELIILTLFGHQIQALFTHMTEIGGDGISGASFGIKNNRPFNIKINGEPLKMAKSYTIITADYLANGGDNYALLPKIKERYKTDIKIRDVIISRIKKFTTEGKQINSTLDKRIYYAD